MRVVIVGATGNAGSALVAALEAEPVVDEVVGIARRTAAPVPGQTKTRFVAADITRDDLVPHLRGADSVVHLAWFFQPTHRPEITWHTNVHGSERVFRAAVDAGVRNVVYASSVGAYSPGKGRIVDEQWPTHSLPVAGYGREKAYVERLLDR